MAATRTSADDVERLEKIVLATSWLVDLLRTVRDVGPPDAFVAAGAIRDLVWNHPTDRPTDRGDADVDVVYLAPGESEDRSRAYASALEARAPGIPWEVVNQAQVHEWHFRQGRRVLPATSLEASLATWPETATAVGVRLADGAGLHIVAPFGLGDLFSLTLRANADCPDSRAYAARVREKRWLSRWPELSNGS